MEIKDQSHHSLWGWEEEKSQLVAEVMREGSVQLEKRKHCVYDLTANLAAAAVAVVVVVGRWFPN